MLANGGGRTHQGIATWLPSVITKAPQGVLLSSVEWEASGFAGFSLPLRDVEPAATVCHGSAMGELCGLEQFVRLPLHVLSPAVRHGHTIIPSLASLAHGEH